MPWRVFITEAKQKTSFWGHLAGGSSQRSKKILREKSIKKPFSHGWRNCKILFLLKLWATAHSFAVWGYVCREAEKFTRMLYAPGEAAAAPSKLLDRVKCMFGIVFKVYMALYSAVMMSNIIKISLKRTIWSKANGYLLIYCSGE